MSTTNETHTLQHPHLAQLRADLDAITERLTKLRNCDEQLFRTRPHPKSWSIAEVLDHLRVAGEQYYGRLAQAIERSRASGAPKNADFRPSLVGRMFIKLAGPESKTKVKAPKIFLPRAQFDESTVLEELIEQQQQLATLIQDADSCSLNKTKFASPATRLVRFTVGDALTLLIRHQERHFLAVDRILANPPSTSNE